MLPVDSDNHTESSYSKFGGAAKLRVLDTVIKAGDVFPATPVEIGRASCRERV